VLRLDGPSIHPAMLTPLLVMAAAFTAYGAVIIILRMDAGVLRARIRRILAEGA
jgi:heme exporter protein C